MKFSIKNLTSLCFVAFLILAMGSCDKCQKDVEPQLVGKPGNPRFNLQFDNEANVDLDLYVTDPNGSTIYYGRTSSRSGGALDVDCLCGDCPQGANENIYWPEDDSAPKGTYKYWVEYYDDCGTGGSRTANFTVRVTNNRTVVATQTGSLSSGKTQVWTYTKN